MKQRFRLDLAATAILGWATCAAAPNALSAPKPATATVHVRVDSAWVRAAPPGATMQAAYMVVHNDGQVPARFVSAQSDAFASVELHQSLLVNGMDTMRPLGEQTIAPGGSLHLAPGGFHLMLMQPTRALKVGDKVKFHLRFADGSAVDVVAPVSAMGPGASGG